MNNFLHSSVLASEDQKKAFFALLCAIFYYYDVEETGETILADFSLSLQGSDELAWASKFVKEDVLTSFERSRKEVRSLMSKANPTDRIEVLSEVWEATKRKGYITEMEANLMLGLARDWNQESDLINLVRMRSAS